MPDKCVALNMEVKKGIPKTKENTFIFAP